MSDPSRQEARGASIHLPYAPLPVSYRSGDTVAREVFLRDAFDSTAVDYDRIEKLLGLGTGSWYRRQALLRAGLRPGMQVVEFPGDGLRAAPHRRFRRRGGRVPPRAQARRSVAGAGDHARRGARGQPAAQGLHARAGAGPRARGAPVAHDTDAVALLLGHHRGLRAARQVLQTLHNAGLSGVERHVELGVFSEYRAQGA